MQTIRLLSTRRTHNATLIRFPQTTRKLHTQKHTLNPTLTLSVNKLFYRKPLKFRQLSTSRSKQDEDEENKSTACSEPKVTEEADFCGFEYIALGTISAKSTGTRNVTSHAIRMKNETWLVDCGEGTQRQLIHTPVNIARINNIFITHNHGDHIFGLPGLILTLATTLPQAVQIYAPDGLQHFIDTAMRVAKAKAPVDYVVHPLYDSKRFPKDAGYYKINFSDMEVVACEIEHTVPTFGYVFTEKPKRTMKPSLLDQYNVPRGPIRREIQQGTIRYWEAPDGTKIDCNLFFGTETIGRKLVILGDTNNPSRIGPYAENADMLVHEATYPSEDQKSAHQRGHSTIADAAKFAATIKAKRLMLNHFGGLLIHQNTTEEFEEKAIEEASKYFNGEIIVAKDFLRVPIHNPPRKLE